HPALVKALQEQATKLWHMSNLFQSPDGEKLATRLCNESFADFVFFCNSGAEALEGVIKLVRHHHFSKGHSERYRIITFEGAFHGRTLATLAATGSAKYLEGFGPPMDGFDQVPHGDLVAGKKAPASPLGSGAERGAPRRRPAPGSSRCRARAACARRRTPSTRRCASSATSMDC